MLKPIALICTLLVTVGNISHFDWGRHKTTAADAASVSVSPANPLVEKGPNGQYLNFDIVIKNTSTHTLYLATVGATVMDPSVKPVLKQSINVNGQGEGIKAIGNTTLKPGETIDIFNPFYTLAPDVKITFLQYEFFFDYADSPQQREANKKRLGVDYDISIKKIITPRAYTPKTNFYLPMHGRLIALDGHNFYPGHHSEPMGASEQIEKIVTSKANRYAFNFVSVDENGEMYKTDPFKKENWYAFGKPVYAPAGGIVVDIEGNLPDNEYRGKTVKPAGIPAEADPYGMGNYVIIDHGNGEFSMLQHLEQNSILVRRGEQIRAGQRVATVGFSGNATFPHLHYTVMNGPKELTAEGIPSYFVDFKLYRGKNFVSVIKGRIDNGDIIEAEK
jgi:murein DD-endopeptidase MepM/ murein hydrolase activator NlpD